MKLRADLKNAMHADSLCSTISFEALIIVQNLSKSLINLMIQWYLYSSSMHANIFRIMIEIY